MLFTDSSGHADGEREGLAAMLKVPNDVSHHDLSFCFSRVAFAVGHGSQKKNPALGPPGRVCDGVSARAADSVFVEHAGGDR